MPLKPSAQKVQNAVLTLGFEFNILEFSQTTRTSAEAAAAIGCTVGQIAKSLVFKTKITGNPILVLASGINRVDEKLIKAEIGENIKRPDADFVREQTGFAIGGIPPLGHTQKLITFIDQDLFLYKEIWAAAGTPNAVFQLTANDLEKMTGGKVIKLKKIP